jgi:hypothetical protein
MIRFFITALFFLLMTSCMAGVEKTGTPLVPHATDNELGLTNASPSIEKLCKEVLEKIARKDLEGLVALALTEDELKKYAWPYMELSRSGRGMPFEYYWGDLQTRSLSTLNDIMGHYAGKKFEFISYRFERETWEYGAGKVHRDSVLIVRNDDGQVGEIKIFGSVFELNGQFKLYSFARRT